VGTWIHYAGFVFLAIALVGIASFHCFFGSRAYRSCKVPSWKRASSSDSPARTGIFLPFRFLNPCIGAEARLRENIESFFIQDYPNYEIIFAADEEGDAAPRHHSRSRRSPSQINCRILVTGPPQYPNPPASSFTRMAEVASYDILVTSDSDVESRAELSFRGRTPMLDPSVGMLTCVYRGKNAGGFWSGMDAIGMSIEMTAGVVTANLREGNEIRTWAYDRHAQRFCRKNRRLLCDCGIFLQRFRHRQFHRKSRLSCRPVAPRN